MATTAIPSTDHLFADKAALRRILEEQDERTGNTFDPKATAAQARSIALAEGIRPEDNILSCGIISAREE